MVWYIMVRARVSDSGPNLRQMGWTVRACARPRGAAADNPHHALRRDRGRRTLRDWSWERCPLRHALRARSVGATRFTRVFGSRGKASRSTRGEAPDRFRVALRSLASRLRASRRRLNIHPVRNAGVRITRVSVRGWVTLALLNFSTDDRDCPDAPVIHHVVVARWVAVGYHLCAQF